jgi:hypothetical protein
VTCLIKSCDISLGFCPGNIVLIRSIFSLCVCEVNHKCNNCDKQFLCHYVKNVRPTADIPPPPTDHDAIFLYVNIVCLP